MYSMVLNMLLNKIWNRHLKQTKKEKLFSRLKSMLSICLFFFTDSWPDMLISVMFVKQKKIKKKHVLQDNFGKCYCLIYLGDKLSGIFPKIPKISPIKFRSAEINRHYPDIAEFQINALIIKSSELLSVYAALVKISYFSQGSLFCLKENCL